MNTLTIPVRIPGLTLPGRPAGPRPEHLQRPGHLLLAGVEPGTRVGPAQHLARWGAPARMSAEDLTRVAERAGLRGHGGAGFPLAVKLEAMRGAAGPVVVNGAEGEAASGKDGVLLRHVPHLVLDGAATAAHALGADTVVVRLGRDRPGVVAAVRETLSERHDRGLRFDISVGPDSFVAGESSAVVNALSGGPALPAALGRPPKLRRGLRSRPVLLSNVETFARLAAAAAGARGDSTLLTVSGAVGVPGVMEVPTTTTLGEVLGLSGSIGSPSVLVTGGWHGAWLTASAAALSAPVTREGLAQVGGRLGAGVLIVLPDDVCPLVVAGEVARLLASASAGQCGPCVHGMPALADAVVRARPLPEVERLAREVTGRGLCGHPGAAASALVSASRLLAGEAQLHRGGSCSYVKGAGPWTD